MTYLSAAHNTGMVPHRDSEQMSMSREIAANHAVRELGYDFSPNTSVTDLSKDYGIGIKDTANP